LTNTRPSSHTSFSLIVTPHLAFKRHEHIRYLNELDIFKGEVNYGVYVFLLHGFFLWHVGEEWEEPSLRRVYKSLRAGIQSREGRVLVTYTVCLTAVRAFVQVWSATVAREVSEFLKPFLKILYCIGRILRVLEVAFEAGEALSAEMHRRDFKYRLANFSTAMPM
jgi:hypothetical protein